MTWWRDAVIYQIYPRSFCDSNGDGIGDLNGITSKLGHLAWLGIDAIWLNPVMPSPNSDWGYDVSDYCDIHPELGTLADFDRLIAEAEERGIRVLNDLVPNHTSSQHPWFVEARSSRTSRYRDWYVWADAKPDGSLPNNWVSSFGGEAWTLDETTGQNFLHLFLPTQPDLNWWNEEVAVAFDQILRFWFDRGVAGFRIDVCHAIIKDRELRDNPPATKDDSRAVQAIGQRDVYTTNRPEVHGVLRRWREVARTFDTERVLLGETYVWSLDALTGYYGASDDELQLCFNIPFVHSRFDASRLSRIVDNVEKRFPMHAWPVWTGSNHDAGRFTSRWCDDDERKVRCALLMLLTLRGTPVLYYGDEIGLPAVELTAAQLVDPVGIRFYPTYAGRDPGRTPMHWTGDDRVGFTNGKSAWLPNGGPSVNVEAQQADPTSVLHFCRDLITLRRNCPDLLTGAYGRRRSPDGTWVYQRGEKFFVALNMSDETAKISRVRGTVRLSTQRDRDDQTFSGGLALQPWEGVVIERP
ncbi:MAG: alpha-amylase family glycosyl hydrolase [Actinomycetota bacterium]